MRAIAIHGRHSSTHRNPALCWKFSMAAGHLENSACTPPQVATGPALTRTATPPTLALARHLVWLMLAPFPASDHAGGQRTSTVSPSPFPNPHDLPSCSPQCTVPVDSAQLIAGQIAGQGSDQACDCSHCSSPMLLHNGRFRSQCLSSCTSKTPYESLTESDRCQPPEHHLFSRCRR